jgi:hypothetical protein
MRKTTFWVAATLMVSLLSNPVASDATEKLANPFDVKVAAAKKVQFGVPFDISAGLTIKKVKRKNVSTYHPINVTIADFKVYDSNTDYRGDAIGYVSRYGFTVTLKNFGRTEEVVGIFTQLWCKNSPRYGENWPAGFSTYPSLPPRTESSGTTIVQLPEGVTSLAECEQPLIYIYPNFSFTTPQAKAAKFPVTVVIPIDPKQVTL